MKEMAEKLFRKIGSIDQSILQEVSNMDIHQLRHSSKRGARIWRAVAAAAAAFVMLAAVPNISPTVAYASYEIPVLGAFFRVVTFRTYDEQERNTSLSGNVPHVVSENERAADETNGEIDVYIDTLINEFKTDNGDFGSLDFDYAIVTDSETWFTLKIFSTEVAASGCERVSYYHIDKLTGETVTLSKLFADDKGYIEKISSYIISEMEKAMANDPNVSYFIGEDGFTEIDPDQSFYFNDAGELVIVFNEYEVAPGCMGIVEFAIPDTVVNY